MVTQFLTISKCCSCNWITHWSNLYNTINCVVGQYCHRVVSENVEIRYGELHLGRIDVLNHHAVQEYTIAVYHCFT